jgi:hypothetical protein
MAMQNRDFLSNFSSSSRFITSNAKLNTELQTKKNLNKVVVP